MKAEKIVTITTPVDVDIEEVTLLSEEEYEENGLITAVQNGEAAEDTAAGSRWEIRFWFGDYVVSSYKAPADFKEAVKALLEEADCLGVRDDLGDEPVATDYVELVDTRDATVMLWYNSYRESGSDYRGDDESILETIRNA